MSTKNTSTVNASTGATSKRPLKDPQSFLGENSSLVNLDNLIKPAVPQNTTNAAAYNPFSDTVIPPKTNLFQQQQPAVRWTNTHPVIYHSLSSLCIFHNFLGAVHKSAETTIVPNDYATRSMGTSK